MRYLISIFFKKTEKYKSPNSIKANDIADFDQQQELEGIINDLEEENGYLIEEYNRLQSQLNSKTNIITSNNTGINENKSNVSTRSSTLNYGHKNRYENYASSETLKNMTKSSRALSSSPTPQQPLGSVLYTASNGNGSNSGVGTSCGSSMYLAHNLPSNNKLPNIFTPLSANANGKSATKVGTCKDSQILAEARMLRQHENRLEARMKILENHNRLLDSQLKQLKGLLNVSFNCNSGSQPMI